jgi:hypothetical protein
MKQEHQPLSKLARKSPLLGLCAPLNNYYWIQPLSLLRLPQLNHKCHRLLLRAETNGMNQKTTPPSILPT